MKKEKKERKKNFFWRVDVSAFYAILVYITFFACWLLIAKSPIDIKLSANCQLLLQSEKLFNSFLAKYFKKLFAQVVNFEWQGENKNFFLQVPQKASSTFKKLFYSCYQILYRTKLMCVKCKSIKWGSFPFFYLVIYPFVWELRNT